MNYIKRICCVVRSSCYRNRLILLLLASIGKQHDFLTLIVRFQASSSRSHKYARHFVAIANNSGFQ